MILVCSYFDLLPTISADPDAVMSLLNKLDIDYKIIQQTKSDHNVISNIKIPGFLHNPALKTIFFNIKLLLILLKLRKKNILLISTRFHLTLTMLLAKKLLRVKWVSIFLDSFVSYEKSFFDSNGNPFYIPVSILKFLEKLNYIYADTIFINSIYEIGILNKKLHPDLYEKIKRTPLSTNMYRCNSLTNEMDKEHIYNELGIENTKFIVMLHGNFKDNIYSYNAAIYLNGIAKKINNDGILFLIAGIGLSDVEFNQNVRYVGYVDNLCKVLSVSDLEVAPLVGGMGIKMKILDALSNGIPVLTTPDGARGFIEPNPLIVENINNISDKIMELYANRNYLASLKIKSFNYFMNYYCKIDKYEYSYVYDLLKNYES